MVDKLMNMDKAIAAYVLCWLVLATFSIRSLLLHDRVDFAIYWEYSGHSNVISWIILSKGTVNKRYLVSQKVTRRV